MKELIIIEIGWLMILIGLISKNISIKMWIIFSVGLGLMIIWLAFFKKWIELAGGELFLATIILMSVDLFLLLDVLSAPVLTIKEIKKRDGG